MSEAGGGRRAAGGDDSQDASGLEDVVSARVLGKGPEGYREALVHLAERA